MTLFDVTTNISKYEKIYDGYKTKKIKQDIIANIATVNALKIASMIPSLIVIVVTFFTKTSNGLFEYAIGYVVSIIALLILLSFSYILNLRLEIARNVLKKRKSRKKKKKKNSNHTPNTDHLETDSVTMP